MSGLVGYGSSDEEDDLQEDFSEERPAKIAKMEKSTTALQDRTNCTPGLEPAMRPGLTNPAILPEQPPVEPPTVKPTADDSTEAEGPAPGPSIPAADVEPSDEPSLSPYSFERQRLRELTMPTHPDFDIPDSPPPPPVNSEEAARLAATTKKFEKFLELKRQGVHFNDRLENTVSLRNPSLLPKLLDFAGLNQEDSYASTLPEGSAVPTKWPEAWYVENLMKLNERVQKKKMSERDKVDFVPSKSAGSSKTTTRSAGTSRNDRNDRR